MDGKQLTYSTLASTNRLDSIVICYEKFLAVRLAKAVTALIAQAPELSDVSGFIESWGVARSMTSGLLSQAVRQPLLDQWVRTSERLLNIGLHKQYPHTHFIRHLKDFGRLVLSWASTARDGAEAEVHLLGRRIAPLMFGRLLIEIKGYSAGDTLRWRVADQVLRIELTGKGLVAEISLAGDMQTSVLKSGCRFIAPPLLSNTVVDIWTPEYVGEKRIDITGESLSEEVERIQLALEEQHVSSISRFCRAMTVSAPGEVWVAGLVRLDSQPGDVSPASLVEQSNRDCIERLLQLNPLDELFSSFTVYGNPHALLVELGAKRLTAQLMGKPLDDSDASLWSEITSLLITSTPGMIFLNAIGEESERAAATVSSSSDSSIPLANALKSSGIENPIFDRLALRKTRNASTSPTDWRAIDSLQYLTPTELKRIYDSAVHNCAADQASAYCAAVSAYILGEFEACRAALLHCLRHDVDVEEYWHLLAFTLRHLDQYETFNSIIFDNIRELYPQITQID